MPEPKPEVTRAELLAVLRAMTDLFGTLDLGACPTCMRPYAPGTVIVWPNTDNETCATCRRDDLAKAPDRAFCELVAGRGNVAEAGEVKR